MFNVDDSTNENNEKDNLKWPYIPDHPYRILIIGGSGSGKTNALHNLIKEQYDDELIDKIYLYAKDLSEPKYKFFIKRCENAEIKHLNYPKGFIEYLNTIDDVYEQINEENPARKRNILIMFDDVIADIIMMKKFKLL